MKLTRKQRRELISARDRITEESGLLICPQARPTAEIHPSRRTTQEEQALLQATTKAALAAIAAGFGVGDTITALECALIGYIQAGILTPCNTSITWRIPLEQALRDLGIEC